MERTVWVKVGNAPWTDDVFPLKLTRGGFLKALSELPLFRGELGERPLHSTVFVLPRGREEVKPADDDVRQGRKLEGEATIESLLVPLPDKVYILVDLAAFSRLPAAAPGAPPAAAAAFASFVALLAAAGIRCPNDRVLSDLQVNHHQVLYTTGTPDAAKRWYEHVRDLPKSPTRGRFKSITGYLLNGGWAHGLNLTLAYDPSGGQLIFKRTMQGRGDPEVTAALTISEGAPPGIVRCEYRNVVDDGGKEFGGLLMKLFARALSSAPDLVLSESILLDRAAVMVAAVRHIHSRGYVHMDIKEANVFVDAAGEWAIGDFGSAVLEHTPITSTTRGLHPAVSAWHHGREELLALRKYDVYMLAALLVRQLDSAPGVSAYPDEGPPEAALRTRAAAVVHVGLQALLLGLLDEAAA